MTAKLNIPNAGDLMTTIVHTVSPDLTLAELVDFLVAHKVSCAPVVEQLTGSKQLVGFISEQDALEHLSNEMFYGLTEQAKLVGAFMKRHPVSITPEIGLFAIASLLVNHGYRHVPVVDEKNRLLGIVSRHDVLQAMKHFGEEVYKQYDSEHFSPDITKIINHRFIVSS